MVDKRIRCKREYDFRRRKLLKNPGDECQFYLRKSSLVEKENGTASPGLSLVDFANDVVGHIFEPAVVDDNLFPINYVSTLRQNSFEVISMSGLDIDEVVFAIEM